MRLSKLALLVLFLFVVSTSSVHASLVVVEPSGRVVINVLADEDEVTLEIPQNEEVKVTNAVAYAPNSNSLVTLKKDGGAVVLSVESEDGKKTLDVSSYKDEVIQIEERPKTEKLSISVNGDKFNIEQDGLLATTKYEITVDSAKARVLLDTPSGKRFLSVSPKEAVQTLLRAKTLNNFSDTEIIIEETGGGDLIYRIDGKKMLNFFDFYEHPVDVTANVSVLTGEIVSVDQPPWLRVIGFLFA